MRKYAFALGFALLMLLAGCASKPQAATGAVVAPAVPWNGQVKEFKVRAFQFGFDPNTIEVSLGDKVKIAAYSEDVPHGFAIAEYGIDLYLDGLREKTVEFIADKPGTFTFYCSIPCGNGHSSMQGKLVVKR